MTAAHLNKLFINYFVLKIKSKDRKITTGQWLTLAFHLDSLLLVHLIDLLS